MNYTEEIEKTALELAQATHKLSALRERLVEIEAIETLEIANAKTPEGKPLYSNEATRSATLVLRLRESAEAAEIKRMIEQAEDRRIRLVARLEHLRGEFKLPFRRTAS